MFLGGWLSPFGGILPQAVFSTPVIGHVLGDGIHWFLIKTSAFLFLYLWLRATFPRFRYDQIMRLGWKVMIPVTLIWIFLLGAAIGFELPPWFDRS